MNQTATPVTGGTTIDNKTFDELVKAAEEIKNKYVKPRLLWYQTHSRGPRLWFRWAGGTTIILSATLPAMALAPFKGKDLALAAMSVVIAILTGFSSFFRWERTWHGNTNAEMAIEQLCAKWELEVKNAALILPSEERTAHVYKATSDLLFNVTGATSSETEGFFSNLAFPLADKGQKSNKTD